MDKLKKVMMVSLLAFTGILVLNIFIGTAKISAAEPAAINVVYYFEDFEANDGGYTHSAIGDGPSSWEWGTPNYTSIAPPAFSLTSAYSGLNAWGTDLDSAYEDRITQTLTSPIIDVSTIPAHTDVILEWQQAWQIESNFDLGYTEISLDGDVWVRIDDGFDGQSNGWVTKAVDVSSAESTVQIRWSLGSDNIGNFGGLYIDDVTLRNPGSGITLKTTVGRDPNECGTEQSITVPYAGEMVYYCYTVTNIGNIDLALHDLTDSVLGEIFTGEAVDLTSSYQITAAAIITDHTENTAVWTSYNAGPTNTTAASSSANVYVFISGELPTTTQLANETVTASLTLNNGADMPLEWAASRHFNLLNKLHTAASEATATPANQLYDNGPLINSKGTGVGGTDESIVQNETLGLGNSGYNHATPLRMADEFTIPNTAEGWGIGTVTFYAFQLDSTTASSISSLNLQIWDGPPNDPNSNIVFGDTTTNRLIDTYWTGAYRIANEAQSGRDTRRPIMASTVYVGATLPAGTYWLDWQTAGSLGSSVFAPPITIAGNATTGNALLFNGANWISIEDTGSNTPQGIPFTLSGCEVMLPEWITITSDNGTINRNSSQKIELTFDSTGYEVGTYTGELCITRNDTQLPAATIPLTMTVAEPAQIRVAHLAPFAANTNTAVDIAINGNVILNDLAFGESTTYLQVASGVHAVNVFESGTQNLLRSIETIQLEPNAHHTILATGGANGYDLEMITLVDDLSASSPGTGKVRITHLSPFAAGLANTAAHIRADGTPSILATLQYGETRAGYLILPANSYDLNITPAGSEELLFDIAPFPLAAGDILDVIAVGDGVNQPINVFAYPSNDVGYLIGEEQEETGTIIYLPLMITR